MIQRAQSPTPPGDDWIADALEAHRAAMFKHALSIVNNIADAEDVVQEALERAWRARGTFAAGAKPAPWLLKITKNVAVDLLRRRTVTDRGLSQQIVAAKDVSGDEFELADDVRSLAGAIRRLTPAHRAVLLLHDVQGYSSREVSTQVRLPYHTVRTHLFRARRKLRAALIGAES